MIEELEKIRKKRIDEINYLNQLHDEEISNKSLYFGLFLGIFASLMANGIYQEIIQTFNLEIRYILLTIFFILVCLFVYIIGKELIKIKARKALSKIDMEFLDYEEESIKLMNNPKKLKESLLHSKSLADMDENEQKKVIDEMNEKGKKWEEWYRDTVKKAGYKFKNN